MLKHVLNVTKVNHQQNIIKINHNQIDKMIFVNNVSLLYKNIMQLIIDKLILIEFILKMIVKHVFHVNN